MKSASNGGILNGSLQVLHVHVLLVAPLGAGHMAQPGTDQHEGGITIREGPNRTGPAADLPIEPLDDIVGPDAGPMLKRKLAVGQRLLNAVFHLLGGLLQLHCPQFFHDGFGLLTSCFLALLSMDGLEHLGHQLHFGTRRNGEYVAVKVNGTALVFGLWKHLSNRIQHPQTLVTNDEFYAVQAAATEPLKEADPAGLVLIRYNKMRKLKRA